MVAFQCSLGGGGWGGGGGGGGGGRTSAPHSIHSWASPNEWVLVEKQTHSMIKTKDLYSTYCCTGGGTHHPLLCLSLSPVRLLHSYVCPSMYFNLSEAQKSQLKVTQVAAKSLSQVPRGAHSMSMSVIFQLLP